MNRPRWIPSRPKAGKQPGPKRVRKLAAESLENRLLLAASPGLAVDGLLPAGDSDGVAAVIGLPPAKDNTLFESVSGSLSNGAGMHFFAGNTRTGNARRGVIAFDVAGNVPAGSTINSVQLTLHMSRTRFNTGQTIGLHEALADWGEGSSDASGDEGGGAAATTGDATWIHTFFNTANWASRGGDFTPAASATRSVGAIGDYTWGSTPQMVADVQGWLDVPADNFGWLLMGNEAAGSTAKRFDTKESTQGPVLTIDFEPPPPPAEVVGRHVFYNNSTWDDPGEGRSDDDAIAPDKVALLPGETATFANYTSYSRGINGVMVDLARASGTPTAEDFRFKVGNDDHPAAWSAAPNPQSVTVRPGEGAGGSDRVTIIWADGAVDKQWLQVTVRAGGRTGLLKDDVSYFGNAIGESDNSPTDAKVNAFDMLAARDNQRSFLDPAPIDFFVDFDRDADVDAADMLIARNNTTHFLNALRLITTPGAKKSAEFSARDAIFEAQPSNLTWLYEFDSSGTSDRPSRPSSTGRAAVDKLFAAHGWEDAASGAP